MLTGLAALQHQGVRVPTTDLIDVLIPASMKRQSLSFVRVHRTLRMPDQSFELYGIRWALAARAVADTARGEFDVREVRAVVASAVQGGKCTIKQLAEEMRAGPKRESSRLREVLEEVADGVRSAAEGDLRLLIKKGGLPEPMYNPDLYVGAMFLARPDVWWQDAWVAAEVDSREWHYSPEHWAEDPGAAQPDERARDHGDALHAQAGQDGTPAGRRGVEAGHRGRSEAAAVGDPDGCLPAVSPHGIGAGLAGTGSAAYGCSPADRAAR